MKAKRKDPMDLSTMTEKVTLYYDYYGSSEVEVEVPIAWRVSNDALNDLWSYGVEALDTQKTKEVDEYLEENPLIPVGHYNDWIPNDPVEKDGEWVVEACDTMNDETKDFPVVYDKDKAYIDQKSLNEEQQQFLWGCLHDSSMNLFDDTGFIAFEGDYEDESVAFKDWTPWSSLAQCLEDITAQPYYDDDEETIIGISLEYDRPYSYELTDLQRAVIEANGVPLAEKGGDPTIMLDKVGIDWSAFEQDYGKVEEWDEIDYWNNIRSVITVREKTKDKSGNDLLLYIDQLAKEGYDILDIAAALDMSEEEVSKGITWARLSA